MSVTNLMEAYYELCCCSYSTGHHRRREGHEGCVVRKSCDIAGNAYRVDLRVFDHLRTRGAKICNRIETDPSIEEVGRVAHSPAAQSKKGGGSHKFRTGSRSDIASSHYQRLDEYGVPLTNLAVAGGPTSEST
ncbi:hypothetical protein DL766_006555 [Monosporascus sp. MC13-8B]|uniref:Uncharacterized protein n=1 Tax=Monosporascus cannonballus TaxID=155416 RepID=A0ABY0HDH2_9PEZI|nr:hypothetical protein DL763_006619 [Monosporascus cannonballus]RYO88974.1 hypothetical protein DL762_003470 [Monosporascus cannonballus]RYP26958.1 hypothetical protein DL766_006555 [Monosporascus sp. MC13-8B]